jgi:hypothetical protein
MKVQYKISETSEVHVEQKLSTELELIFQQQEEWFEYYCGDSRTFHESR